MKTIYITMEQMKFRVTSTAQKDVSGKNASSLKEPMRLYLDQPSVHMEEDKYCSLNMLKLQKTYISSLKLTAKAPENWWLGNYLPFGRAHEIMGELLEISDGKSLTNIKYWFQAFRILGRDTENETVGHNLMNKHLSKTNYSILINKPWTFETTPVKMNTVHLSLANSTQ